jgi:hypothetical protein
MMTAQHFGFLLINLTGGGVAGDGGRDCQMPSNNLLILYLARQTK